MDEGAFDLLYAADGRNIPHMSSQHVVVHGLAMTEVQVQAPPCVKAVERIGDAKDGMRFFAATGVEKAPDQ